MRKTDYARPTKRRRATVTQLAAKGHSREEICALIGTNMTTLRERYPLELSAGRAMARAAKEIDDEFARLPGLTEQEQNQIRLVWRSDSWFAPDGTCDLFGGARTPQEAAAVVLKMRNRFADSED